MSPRTGRPITGDEPKDKRIALRATAKTVERLRKCSEMTGKTQTVLLEEMVNHLYCELMDEK